MLTEINLEVLEKEKTQVSLKCFSHGYIQNKEPHAPETTPCLSNHHGGKQNVEEAYKRKQKIRVIRLDKRPFSRKSKWNLTRFPENSILGRQAQFEVQLLLKLMNKNIFKGNFTVSEIQMHLLLIRRKISSLCRSGDYSHMMIKDFDIF